MDLYPYRYSKQFERYLSQFGRVLSGFQVQDGVLRGTETEPYTRRVKVVYGSMSRIVASVLNKRSAFTNNTLPMIAFNLASIERDIENKKTHHHEDHIVYKDGNDQRRAYRRLMGPAFTLSIDVSIYASSTDELFSILEQMLLIFNPRVAIQVDNDVRNSDYITEIELESIQNEINYPLGTESRIVQQSMTFRVPVRLAYPSDLDASYVEVIKARILQSSEDGISEFVISEEEITGEE